MFSQWTAKLEIQDTVPRTLNWKTKISHELCMLHHFFQLSQGLVGFLGLSPVWLHVPGHLQFSSAKLYFSATGAFQFAVQQLTHMQEQSRRAQGSLGLCAAPETCACCASAIPKGHK